jgi:hypothetical protein
MSPTKLKMQPTIHFQSERSHFKYRMCCFKMKTASNNFICHNQDLQKS